MPEYRVRWEIEVDADTPLEAAEKALAIHRNQESIATVFDVLPLRAVSSELWQRFDLTPDADDQVREATDALKHERRHGDPG